MRAKLVSFQNYGGFIEYAVLTKKYWWSRWRYLRNESGHKALYRFVDADALVVKYNGGNDK